MTKTRVRMAGSILEKIRGLNINNRAISQISLNYTGPRVDSIKMQGLFCKRSLVDRYPSV